MLKPTSASSRPNRHVSVQNNPQKHHTCKSRCPNMTFGGMRSPVEPWHLRPFQRPSMETISDASFPFFLMLVRKEAAYTTSTRTPRAIRSPLDLVRMPLISPDRLSLNLLQPCDPTLHAAASPSESSRIVDGQQ